MKVLQKQERIADVDGCAVFVTHDDPGLLRRTMLADLTVPFPVLVDQDRRTYRDWGLTRATFAQVWLDPEVWRQYARMLVGGEKLRRGGRDTLQLGGDFVIAPDRTVSYARPQHRDDRPAVGLLVEELEDAARSEGR